MTRISLSTRYENVYIDTSAHIPRRSPRPRVESLREHGNAARVLVFGSDAS